MKKEILLISAAPLERAGVQNFLLEWIKAASKDKYRFIWYFLGPINDKKYAEEFVKENVFLVAGNVVKSKQGRIYLYKKVIADLFKLLKNNKIDAIHVNTGGICFQWIVLYIAKLHDVKIRIAHSHNAYTDENELRKIFNYFTRKMVLHYATKCIACSYSAAEHLFGKKAAKDCLIVNNFIDTKKFAFKPKVRNEYRERLMLEDKYIIGHVGIFNIQKNHNFLIEIFNILSQKDESIYLLLIGTGELEDIIKKKIYNYNLSNKVRFVGVTEAVNEYMFAMDLFVLPSLHEGLPLVGIEAQCSGLPCIFSDNITKELKMTEYVKFIRINNNPEEWVKEILNIKNSNLNNDRINAWRSIYNKGYDKSNILKNVENVYEE